MIYRGENWLPFHGTLVYPYILFYHGSHRLLSRLIYSLLYIHFLEHDVCCYFNEWACLIFWLLFPHKKYFLNVMSSHQKKFPTGLLLIRRSTFLVYFTCSSRHHCIYIMRKYLLPHWCTTQILLLLETSKTLPIRLLMWLICHCLRFPLLVLILVILLLYCYQDHFYQINLILGSLHVNTCPCLILH